MNSETHQDSPLPPQRWHERRAPPCQAKTSIFKERCMHGLWKIVCFIRLLLDVFHSGKEEKGCALWTVQGSRGKLQCTVLAAPEPPARVLHDKSG